MLLYPTLHHTHVPLSSLVQTTDSSLSGLFSSTYDLLLHPRILALLLVLFLLPGSCGGEKAAGELHGSGGLHALDPPVVSLRLGAVARQVSYLVTAVATPALLSWRPCCGGSSSDSSDGVAASVSGRRSVGTWGTWWCGDWQPRVGVTVVRCSPHCSITVVRVRTNRCHCRRLHRLSARAIGTVVTVPTTRVTLYCR